MTSVTKAKSRNFKFSVFHDLQNMTTSVIIILTSQHNTINRKSGCITGIEKIITKGKNLRE